MPGAGGDELHVTVGIAAAVSVRGDRSEMGIGFERLMLAVRT